MAFFNRQADDPAWLTRELYRLNDVVNQQNISLTVLQNEIFAKDRMIEQLRKTLDDLNATNNVYVNENWQLKREIHSRGRVIKRSNGKVEQLSRKLADYESANYGDRDNAKKRAVVNIIASVKAGAMKNFFD